MLLVLFISCSRSQPTIYEWRGPNRSGIYNDTNLLKEWPQNGPTELWSNDGIGNGYGSPTITGDGIYISGEIDSTAYLFHFDLHGKILWKSAIGSEWNKNYPGSRSTPTIVDDLIYIGSGKGNLFCLDRKDGKIIWSKDFSNDFQGQYTLFGIAESPVVSGDKVFWVPGGKEHNVVALDRKTGKQIWSCKGFGERSGYTPSKLIKLPSREIFVTFSAYHLMGIDANTGQLLWSHQQENIPIEKRDLGYGDTHANTPLFEDGFIYYVAGDGNGAVKLSLSQDGSKITEVWRTKEFDSFMGGVVKIGNYLYGSGTEKKELFSLDATTGKLADSLKIGSGVVIAAVDRLYYYNQQGEMNLLKYDQGKMEVVNTFKIKQGTKEHFSHPVIHNGILYLRHGNTLMVFDVRKKS